MDAPKAHPDIAIIRYPGDRLKNGSCRGVFVSMVHTCAMKKFDTSDRAKGAVNRFTQDNFIETVDFDYLEIQVIEE